MVGRKLFLVLVLFLTACAEIIPLSGGESDDAAPVVVEQYPEQGALYVSTNRLELRFNEFYQLVDPASTIQINPSLGKLEVEQFKKRLVIEWKDTLQKNTTYVIQLNGTIKDLHEGNDTIQQFAFATGDKLDTLSIKGQVSEVLNNEAKGQVTIGLYKKGANPLTDKPNYATRSSAKGEFKFGFLPVGEFQVYAFNDKNRNQSIDPLEEVAFQDKLVSSTDTSKVNVRLFPPKKSKIRMQAVLNHPGAVTVFGRDSLLIDSLRINGQKATLFKCLTQDSLLIALPESSKDNWELIYRGDTIFKTRDAKLKLEKLKPTLLKKDYFAGDSIRFEMNDRIVAIDTQAIQIKTELEDSLPFTYRFDKNNLVLFPLLKAGKNVTIRLNDKAIKGGYSSNDTLNYQLPMYTLEDLSVLKINLENFSGQWIIQLMKGKEIVYSTIKSKDTQVITFERIIPGGYTVKCIQDSNENGQWDTGNLAKRIQAENIVNFTLKQKMRPNWEVEETLQYKP